MVVFHAHLLFLSHTTILFFFNFYFFFKQVLEFTFENKPLGFKVVSGGGDRNCFIQSIKNCELKFYGLHKECQISKLNKKNVEGLSYDAILKLFREGFPITVEFKNHA